MKRLNAREQAREALAYLSECRRYIYFATIFFFLSVIFGFIFSSSFGFIDKMLAELANQTKDLNGLELIFYILQNNVQAALATLAFGLFFGILPILNIITNGVVLGYVLNLVWQVSGAGEFWRILPHGIFELPAIFISAGMGIRLGLVIFSKREKKEFRRIVYESVNAFLFAVIPLLIVAAVIEGVLIAFAVLSKP